MDRVRLFILDTADDEPALWELSDGLVMVEGSETREVYPRMPIAEVRPAVEQLLREGHVQVFAFWPATGTDLALNEALEVVRDDRNWMPPAETEQPVAYALTLTPSGEAAYHLERGDA